MLVKKPRKNTCTCTCTEITILTLHDKNLEDHKIILALILLVNKS